MMISETSKVRKLVERFCQGNGVDIGHGGDAINNTAIRIDLDKMYTNVGNDVTQLKGDGRNLYWFEDNVLDYVYSSHLLEDFEDTYDVLKEWVRVLKYGGKLVLVLPDEQIYREYCRKNGFGTNEHHKMEYFNSIWVEMTAFLLGNVNLIHESGIVYDYNFILVFEKIKREPIIIEQKREGK
jgi:ubiquinone/menaquinone biosynthesis C-methylase UbiE